jgi:hypothetical protein
MIVKTMAKLERPILSRRVMLGGGLAAGVVFSLPQIRIGRAWAQSPMAGDKTMYFVPGGRIGLRKPNEINVWSDSWTLLSADHTLMVDVREIIRLGAYNDEHIWATDKWSPGRAERIEP